MQKPLMTTVETADIDHSVTAINCLYGSKGLGQNHSYTNAVEIIDRRKKVMDSQ